MDPRDREIESREEKERKLEKDISVISKIPDTDFSLLNKKNSSDVLKSWDSYRDTWGLHKDTPSPPKHVLNDINKQMYRKKLVEFEHAIVKSKLYFKHVLENTGEFSRFKAFHEDPKLKNYVFEKNCK